MFIGAAAVIIAALLVLLAAFLAAPYGLRFRKGMVSLPPVPTAFVILACTAPAPVPASCLSTGRQQPSC